MSRVYDFEQYSPDWFAARRGKPTASNFHRIITAKKGELASAHKNYIAELIGDELNPNYPETDDRATAAMRRGTAMEPRARALYELWSNSDVRQVGFITTDCGRFGDSPDGLVGEDRVCEYKCPSASVFAGWVLDGVLPDDYRAQCHGHLLIAEKRQCDFFAYFPSQPPFILPVLRDDFTDKLAKCLIDFDAAYQQARKRFGLSYMTEPVVFRRPATLMGTKEAVI
jgi:YqaJ-like viral recombinase domain